MHKVIAMDSVESSQIHSIGHDGVNTMAILFKRYSGELDSEYHYENVSPEQFKEFKEAPSIGKHFATFFKSKVVEHPFKKIVHKVFEDESEEPTNQPL